MHCEGHYKLALGVVACGVDRKYRWIYVDVACSTGIYALQDKNDVDMTHDKEYLSAWIECAYKGMGMSGGPHRP